IREACMKLGTEHLLGTTIYVLAHPCPMCLGSLYYCSPDEVIFLTTRDAYEPHHVDDRKYFELNSLTRPFPQVRRGSDRLSPHRVRKIAESGAHHHPGGLPGTVLSGRPCARPGPRRRRARRPAPTRASHRRGGDEHGRSDLLRTGQHRPETP